MVDGIAGRRAWTTTLADRFYDSEALSGFLRWTLQRDMRPVVVSQPDTRASFPAAYRLLRTRALWLRLGDSPDGGFRDLRSGAVYASIDEVPDEPEDVGFVSPPLEDSHVWIGFSVSVQHRADEATTLGEAAAILWHELTGAAPAAWGWHEPCLAPWNKVTYTESARSLMPYATMDISGGVTAQAVGVARRNQFGVEDAVSGLAVAGPAGQVDMAEIGARAVAALRAVAQALPTPSIGVISVTHGGPQIQFAAPLTAPVMPLAVIVGPRAMRALGTDAASFAAQHGGLTAGLGKFPSLIMPLFGTGIGVWERLRHLIGEFSADQLAAALFLPRPNQSPNQGGRDAS